MPASDLDEHDQFRREDSPLFRSMPSGEIKPVFEDEDDEDDEAQNPADVLVRLRHGGTNQLSPQAQRVLKQAELALTLFVEKNRGYGTTAYELGAKGQYADMNRKMGKLKHTLWNGNPAVGESVEEMLQDLFGHVLLALDFLEQERKELQ